MPQADSEDAWIVTVTADGKLFFGADPMTPEELTNWMITHPRNRDARLYIKADARAPFAGVQKVLEIGRATHFETPVLLTAQAEHTAPGAIVPPKGLDVSVGPASPSGAVATVVQLSNSSHPQPRLSVNGDEIAWSALESTLRRHFEKGDPKVILLKADQQLPFGQVAQAIDACRAAGARITLETRGV
jgi:biopolymer transport protein ExbD